MDRSSDKQRWLQYWTPLLTFLFRSLASKNECMLIRCLSMYVIILLYYFITDSVIQNHVYDEHMNTLQIYWSTRDVISWLAENSDDEHLKKVKQTAEQHALKMEVASRSVHDESALFDEDDTDEIVIGRIREDTSKDKLETSKQRLLSQAKLKPEFEGLRTTASGHKIQDIRELMTVPVSFLTMYAFLVLIYGVI